MHVAVFHPTGGNMNEAYSKWWGSKAVADMGDNHMEVAFLAGLAAAEQVCEKHIDAAMDVGDTGAMRTAATIADAIKAMREKT